MERTNANQARKRVPATRERNPRVEGKDGKMTCETTIKALWKSANSIIPLRAFARALANNPEAKQTERSCAQRWLKNKQGSPKALQLATGSTRKKKGKSKAGAGALDGRA